MNSPTPNTKECCPKCKPTEKTGCNFLDGFDKKYGAPICPCHSTDKATENYKDSMAEFAGASFVSDIVPTDDHIADVSKMVAPTAPDTQQDWEARFDRAFVEFQSDYQPYIINYKENDSQKVADIKSFIRDLLAAEREAAIEMYREAWMALGIDRGRTAALKEVVDICEELKAKLVDRDTNFGMNESYRLALDELITRIRTETK